MKLSQYILELYRTKRMTCYEEMSYKEKAYATSLVLDQISAVEFPDFVANYQDPIALKAAMQGLLEGHEMGASTQVTELYKENIVNAILQGAIAMSRMVINDAFAEAVSFSSLEIRGYA